VVRVIFPHYSHELAVLTRGGSLGHSLWELCIPSSPYTKLRKCLILFRKLCSVGDCFQLALFDFHHCAICTFSCCVITPCSLRLKFFFSFPWVCPLFRSSAFLTPTCPTLTWFSFPLTFSSPLPALVYAPVRVVSLFSWSQTSILGYFCTHIKALIEDPDCFIWLFPLSEHQCLHFRHHCTVVDLDTSIVDFNLVMKIPYFLVPYLPPFSSEYPSGFLGDLKGKKPYTQAQAQNLQTL